MKQKVFSAVKRYFIDRSRRHQERNGIPSLNHWGLELDTQNHLAVAGINLRELAARYGSPLLVVNRAKLVEDAEAIQKAVEGCGRGSKVVYSYKTNCIPGILSELHRVGLGAEVISPYELWLAEQLEVPGDMVVYNGVNKTEESLSRAVKMGVLCINIDCLSEIDRTVEVAKRLNQKARVGVRLAFDSKSQFGLSIDSGEAMEACRRIQQNAQWLDFNTIHFSVVSNSRESGTHCYFARRSLEFIDGLRALGSVEIDFLDVGGGIGVPTSRNMDGKEYGLYRLFDCLPKAPDLDDFEDIDSFVQRIDQNMKKTCRELNLKVPALMIEPGRFVTSRCEYLLSSVLSVKRRTSGPTFAITDTGRLSLTFPCDFERHFTVLANQEPIDEKELYYVMGRICTSADWMAKNIILPKLSEGDLLVTMDAGAYFSSYSSNFAFPRPAIVMVDEDGKVSTLREAESFEHMVALDGIN